MTSDSLPYSLALLLAAGGAGYLAYDLSDLTLATGAGVVAAYALHLFSLRRAHDRCRYARILERLSAELEGTVASETVVIRRFDLAAVALIEGAMEVEEVVRTLVSSGGAFGNGFGSHALEKGFLTAEEVKSLTETRREARFLTDQVRLARRKVREFRRTEGDGAR